MKIKNINKKIIKNKNKKYNKIINKNVSFIHLLFILYSSLFHPCLELLIMEK